MPDHVLIWFDVAQQFRISESAAGAIRIDYPPCFDGVFTDFVQVLSTLDILDFIGPSTLLTDMDRDGAITTNDLYRTDEFHPYRFRVDEGANADYPEADLEARANAHLYVHTLTNGIELSASTNHFSFSSVTNMYRTMNLRAGGTSYTNEPPNWPDDLTNGKDFVFVHGYNVDESAGREWNNTISKRLWHAGSNARFNGILWDGTPPASLGNKHYHNAVVNAFASAPIFATYLNGLDEPVVMAHSLGNMVTSSAVCDPGAGVYQYYAMNAAVAKEAYGDSAPNENMIPDGSLIYNQDEG